MAAATRSAAATSAMPAIRGLRSEPSRVGAGTALLGGGVGGSLLGAAAGGTAGNFIGRGTEHCADAHHAH